MSSQNCMACQRPLTGRIDKRFCDSQCRATYHNHNKRRQERIIQSVNRQLRKNRTILKNFCPDGKATVRKERLVEAGFSFQYFSSIFKQGKLTYYFCYEYGYAAIHEFSSSDQTEMPKVLIVQAQEYMKGKFDPWKIR